MRKGTKHTKETIKKIREAMIGRKWSTETRKNVMSSRSKTQKRGEDHHLWKGGKYDKDGYKMVSNGKGKYRFEHRVVVEKHIGRKLSPNENVHHKNGVKDDNRISNLEIVAHSSHFGEVVCPHCKKKFKLK